MRRWVVILLLATASAGVAWGVARLPAAEPFALELLDLHFALYADPAAADRRIVLIEVDQASLDHFEHDNIAFPWPRSLYNAIVEYCARGGARAVVFDILFNNISPYGEAVDRAFAAALRKAGNAYLAAAFTQTGQASAELARRHGLELQGPVPARLRKNGASLPLDTIASAAAGLGSVMFNPDRDGVYRRISPVAEYGGRAMPALAFAPLVTRADVVRIEAGSFFLGDLRVPVDERGDVLLNFHGRRGTYRRYSAAAVIGSAVSTAGRAPVPPEVFRDAYVLVGYTAPGLYDLKPTPLSSVSPGLEVHAAALDNALNGDFLQTAPGWLSPAVTFASTLAVVVSVLTGRTGRSLVVIGLVLGALWGGVGLGFVRGVWVDLFVPLVGAMLAVIGSSVWEYGVEGRQRRFIQRAMSLYVSPKLVERVIADPSSLKLGGEKRELTVFFSDLVGFTTIAERMDPAMLVRLLNEYTTLMEEVVTARDGTVDKYIGDAVMAFWGAPVPNADHAFLACAAALESRRRLEQFRDDLRRRELPAPEVRMGLSTGVCVVGNMGSERRFAYTAVGDAVNEAARLETLNKAYGTGILVGELTWREVSDRVFGRPVDYVRLRGKDIPARVHEIVALRESETEEQRTVAKLYGEALQAYQERRWDDAIDRASSLVERFGDGPSRTLVHRATTFRREPPPSDWDGVAAMEDG